MLKYDLHFTLKLIMNITRPRLSLYTVVVDIKYEEIWVCLCVGSYFKSNQELTTEIKDEYQK